MHRTHRHQHKYTPLFCFVTLKRIPAFSACLSFITCLVSFILSCLLHFFTLPLRSCFVFLLFYICFMYFCLSRLGVCDWICIVITAMQRFLLSTVFLSYFGCRHYSPLHAKNCGSEILYAYAKKLVNIFTPHLFFSWFKILPSIGYIHSVAFTYITSYFSQLYPYKQAN